MSEYDDKSQKVKDPEYTPGSASGMKLETSSGWKRTSTSELSSEAC